MKSQLISTALSVCLLTNNSCVRYSATSYEAISRELNSYSPNVRVKLKTGEVSDMQVLEVTKNSLKGYSLREDVNAELDISKSSIATLTQKDMTKFGSKSSEAGQAVVKGVVIGIGAALLLYLYLLDQDSGDDFYSRSY